MSFDVGAGHQAVKYSFAHVLHKLAYKYSRHEDDSDVVDLESMRVVENKGRLASLPKQVVGETYQDHHCLLPAIPSLPKGVNDGDGECEPDEYTDLEEEEDEENSESDADGEGEGESEAEGAGSCDEDSDASLDDDVDPRAMFACTGHPDTCPKPFCFACAMAT